jgi:carbonic anhydrase
VYDPPLSIQFIWTFKPAKALAYLAPQASVVAILLGGDRADALDVSWDTVLGGREIVKFNLCRGGLLTLSSVAMLAVPASCAAQGTTPSWSYSGKSGDSRSWGKLDPAYSLCDSGTTQSPVDIRTKHLKMADLPPLVLDYRPVTLNMIDNGHSIQVNYPKGSTLTVGGHVYALTEFHFHHPSENRENGKALPLEAQLVHTDASGKLAVVAVFFDLGGPNLLLDVLWRNIPAEKDKAVSVSAASITASDLLPANRGYYTFAGSLTTPPCSEGVTWYVLKNHSTISKEQLDVFAKLYKKNVRPLQKMGGRAIQQSK